MIHIVDTTNIQSRGTKTLRETRYGTRSGSQWTENGRRVTPVCVQSFAKRMLFNALILFYLVILWLEKGILRIRSALLTILRISKKLKCIEYYDKLISSKLRRCLFIWKTRLYAYRRERPTMQRAMNELMRDIFGCEHDNRLRPETDEKVRHTSNNDALDTNFILSNHSMYCDLTQFLTEESCN